MSLPKGLLVHPDELSDFWLDRLRGSSVRILGLHPVGGKKAHESLEELYNAVKRGEYAERFRKLKQMGIELEYEVHAMSWLLPRTLFEAHPDWFRENGEGERVADFNLCPSSREALQYIADRAAELARVLTPTTHRYHLWIDDVRDSFCHCSACRALSLSDQALRIYNALLSGLRTVDPQATQCYLAYQKTISVPATETPSDGIFLEYAPIDRDMHRPLSDAACEKNVSEVKALPALLEFFGRKGAKVLEYWLDNSLFSRWKKPPAAFFLDVPVLREDMKFYENLGFEDVTVFACYLGEDYEALHGAPDIAAYIE